jgi:hypothetical protein
MRLAKQGYGDIEQMHNLDVKRFIDLIHYENYLAEYDKTFRELNKKG